MQPSYSSVGQIFSTQMRYVVPLFQRPYVWGKDEQWQPLYDDIKELAERVLDPPSHKPVAGHFLGTAVLEHVMTPAVEMQQRRIIDGQQRLTTLQIVLKSAVEALREVGDRLPQEERAPLDQARGKLELLCFNQFASSEEAKFKVWPTNDDRQQFRSILEWQPDSAMPAGTRMSEAFSFFKNLFQKWLQVDRTSARAAALSSAMGDHLRMIVLDLDPYDEPQAIFETLNAHGTPLLPADLIKNWLLWEAGKQELDANALYSSHWSTFDSDHQYWRKVVGTGHAARPRVDTFLQNWLTLETRETISGKHLYDRFLAHAAGKSAATIDSKIDLPLFMSGIQSDARRYRQIDEATLNGEVGRRMRRLNKLDYIVFRPALIGLMRYGDINPAVLEDGVRAIESYLVRRMVCGEQTRGYGKVAVDLVAALEGQSNDGDRLIAMMNVLEESGWPDDARFGHHWRKSRFYGWFRKARVLTILQAIEMHYQENVPKSERLSVDVEGLTIEHIMPQAWQARWPLPEGSDPLARDSLVQNIGNLTLVTSGLNPALSNNAWGEPPNSKQSQIKAHSKLELNARLLAQAADEWNDGKIGERAETLFETAKGIWPAREKFPTWTDAQE